MNRLEIPLAIDGHAIDPHAHCGKAHDLRRQFLRRAKRAAFVDHAIGKPHRQSFIGIDRPPCQDHIERPSLAHDARQANRTTVDQRDAPAAAEHAEHRTARGDAQIAPQGEFKPPCDRMTLDCGDDRFRHQHSRRPHRSDTFWLIRVVTPAHSPQVEAGTEISARPGQDSCRQAVVFLELGERLAQCNGRFGIDGVPAFRPIDRDGTNRAFV